MTGSEWLAVLAVIAGLMVGLPLIRGLCFRSGASPEVARKSAHVVMGLACAAFPWIFERPLPVWVLAGIATLLLGVLRMVPALRRGVGSALHGIKRLSYGEILFAPAVATVFFGAQGNPLLHVIPIGILTISDAAGALAGTRWGRMRYGCGDGFKTVEGSAIFLVTAFLCAFVPLWFFGNMGHGNAMWISLILAILAMMAEGISDRGFDNLVVPLGCYFVLGRLLPLEEPALVGRFTAAVLLLILVVWGGRWSTLNGGALLGGALLGYGCAVIADWRYALPPVAVFLCHLVTTRKCQLKGAYDHRLDAVLAHAIGCLPWVLLAGVGLVPKMAGLAGVSFAMAALLAMMHCSTRHALGMTPPGLWSPVWKGWWIAALPGLMWFWPDYGRLAWPAVVSVLAAVVMTRILKFLRPRYDGSVTGLWVLEGSLALLGSLPALWIRI